MLRSLLASLLAAMPLAAHSVEIAPNSLPDLTNFTPPPGEKNRYHAQGNAIIGLNQGRFFSRPHYTANTDAFILTGDKPMVKFASGGTVHGHFFVGVKRGSTTKWLHDFSEITAAFQPAQTIWQLTDPAFPNLILRLQVLTLGSPTGFAARLNTAGALNTDQLIWAYGGSNTRNEKLNWTIDPYPVGEAALLRESFNPQTAHANQASTHEAPLTNSFSLAAKNGGKLTFGRVTTGSLALADATAWQSPASLLASEPGEHPMIVGSMPLTNKNPAHCSFTLQDQSPTSLTTDTEPTALFKAGLARSADFASRLIVNTPDARINAAAADKPVKVYIMSGQSNMVGYGRVGGTHPATLESITSQGKRFSHLVDGGSGWVARGDVRYRGVVAAEGDAPLAPGFAANTNSFGPELGFGHVMGWYHGEPVLLIKAAQGGRALGWDFLPPGSVSYPYGANTYAGYGDSPGSWTTGSTPTPGQFYGGYQFDQSFKRFTDWHPYSIFASVTNAASVLDSFASHYGGPDKPFAGRDFEIGGFVWWQGWNDGLSYTGQYATRYEQNMVRFIKEIRSYYETIYPNKGAAKAPFVLATAAFQGFANPVANRTVVVNAQLAVDGEAKKPDGDPNYPEFVGNVKTIDARHYWRSSGPASDESHYHHNAETYILTGDALGRAMVELLESGSQPGTGYATWAGGFAGLTDSNPALDFDKGGLATALEWVLGGDPTDSSDDAGLMPTIDNATDPDGKLLFNFRRSNDSHADENTGITVQYGNDLNGWTTAAHQGSGPNDITISSLPDGPGFSKVTVALPASLADGGRLFFRLKVTVAQP